MEREPPASRARAWYVVALLFGVYVMNMADRQIVGILAQDIKRDLALTDAQLGFLGGPAIGFFYAILGIPMAYAADRIHRVRFIAGCIAVWSFFTILGGRVNGFVQLALTRVGVSIAEAGGSPSSVSLIADLFPAERRGTAMAVWTSASTVAIFVGFAVGGVVNETLGWRNTFLAAGIPGLILAVILVATVREPVRGAADAVAAPKAELGLFATFAKLWAIKPFRQMVFAVSACNFCVFAVLNWAPAHAMRSFDLGSGAVGGVMGTGIALAGGTMMVLTGMVTDWLTKGGLHRAVLLVAAMMLVSASAFVAAFMASDFTTFSIFFLIGYAALMTNPPVSWVILQKYSPPEMRAMATAVLLLVIALTAMVPAPWIIGRVSDLLNPAYGVASLGYALLLAPAAVLLAALLWARTAATIKGTTMSESGLNPQQIGI
ncbi:MFS transporter [Sphingomonas sp. AOB5]|uniref:spinster family MFS transporter n=1 Tax=Sphingomonas sp. AOB5 TaxID=3034017 RepID=UPI0023F7B5CE|nr:MFS transporter [Sphingomonas sp. AOB5]MDF7776717.1 MFS transporter [Sphingomonas sp. AOB5]